MLFLFSPSYYGGGGGGDGNVVVVIHFFEFTKRNHIAFSVFPFSRIHMAKNAI